MDLQIIVSLTDECLASENGVKILTKNDHRVFSELNTTFREIYEKQNTASFHI